MKNKIVIILGILAIIALAFFAIKNVSFAPTEEVIQNDNPIADVEKIKISPEVNITLPLSSAPKDVAWAVFQTYLNYNKNRNLEGVKNVVYKIADVCADPKTRIDCEARMGAAYSYGSVFKKENFTNIWNDEKQIILSTDFWLESSEDLDQYGRFRSIIFFVKGDNDSWKLLSFSPTQGGATSKGMASQEEVDDRLITYTQDKDQDGISDYIEECIPADTKDTCIPTNPKTRDTNGNGWWDGVEALMN